MKSTRIHIFMKMVGCMLCATFVLFGCKKDTTSSSSHIALMEGNHSWVGKFYFFNYDTSIGKLYVDSATATFKNSIHVLNGSTIVVDSTFLTNLRNDTMVSFFTGTTGISFMSSRYYSSGLSSGGLKDSLVYNYRDNTFIWYENVDGGISTSHAWLHSP